jgi:hypothetical protein
MTEGPSKEISFEKESPGTEYHADIYSGKVTERDVFKLAKWILLACLLVFLLTGTFKTWFSTNPGIDEVWKWAHELLNPVIYLVLGLYFGKKDK